MGKQHSVFYCRFQQRFDAVYEKAACPRSLLRRVKTNANRLGFKAVFAQEFEWFNFAGYTFFFITVLIIFKT
jgi:glutamine synthetase